MSVLLKNAALAEGFDELVHIRGHLFAGGPFVVGLQVVDHVGHLEIAVGEMSVDVGSGLIEVDQMTEINVFGTGGDKHFLAADVSEVKRSLKSHCIGWN